MDDIRTDMNDVRCEMDGTGVTWIALELIPMMLEVTRMSLDLHI